MFLNKLLLIDGGIAVVGTGTGLGIYYGTQKGTQDKNKEKEVPVLGKSKPREDGVSIPPNGSDEIPTPLPNLKPTP